MRIWVWWRSAPSNHRPEDEGMGIVEERSEVEGIDMEDMTMEVEVVEREHEDMVLARH
jgi:hypothetical protein